MSDVNEILDRIQTHGIAYFSREQEEVIIAALRAFRPEEAERYTRALLRDVALYDDLAELGGPDCRARLMDVRSRVLQILELREPQEGCAK